MKKLILIFIFFIYYSFPANAEDILLLRSGEEIFGDIQMISNGNISISTDNGDLSIPTNKAYMIKYHKKGSAFFTPEGDMRFDTEQRNSEISEKDIAIYLCEGAEIIASSIKIDGENIEYKPSNKNLLSGITKLFSKKDKEWAQITKNEIFLIKYGDGMKNIINPFSEVDKDEKNIQRPSVNHIFVQINAEENYPYPAKIILKDKREIPTIVYDKIDGYTYYRKKTWQDGPIYRINNNLIEQISTLK